MPTENTTEAIYSPSGVSMSTVQRIHKLSRRHSSNALSFLLLFEVFSILILHLQSLCFAANIVHVVFIVVSILVVIIIIIIILILLIVVVVVAVLVLVFSSSSLLPRLHPHHHSSLRPRVRLRFSQTK